MTTIWLRLNHAGWAHLWRREEDYLGGEASFLFFDPRSDPRWPALSGRLSPEQRKELEKGDLIALEEGGILADDLLRID